MNVPTLPGPAPTGSAPTGSTPGAGRTGATEGGEAPAGFPAMLVGALAGEEPDPGLVDPEAIDLGAITELAAAIEELTPPTDEAGVGETPDGEIPAEVLAALLLSGSGARPELLAAVLAWRQQATGSDDAGTGPNAAAPSAGPVADAASAAGAMTSTTGAQPVPQGAPVAATPASAGSAPEAASVTAQVESPSSTPVSSAGPATAATPTLPAAATDRARQAVAEAPARVAVDGAEAPAPASAASAPSSSNATPAAPTAAAPAPAGPDASLHARIVSRVIQAAEALEHAPPPRTMMVELPDGEGLRLQVSLRGTEVHVQLQGAAGQGTDLGAWGRELAAGLADRGLSLGQFQTGTERDRGQGQDQAPADDLPAEDDRTANRPADRRATDGALRL